MSIDCSDSIAFPLCLRARRAATTVCFRRKYGESGSGIGVSGVTKGFLTSGTVLKSLRIYSSRLKSEIK